MPIDANTSEDDMLVPVQARLRKRDLDELMGNALTDTVAQAVVVAVRSYNIAQRKKSESAA